MSLNIEGSNEFKIPDLCIVIPIKNEERSIKTVVEELSELITENDLMWEIVVVDDGSTDDSYTVLKALQIDVPFLRVVSYFPSRGQSYAIQEGVRSSKAKLIGIIDGDGQNVPSDLLRMYREISIEGSNLHLIQGTRYPHRKDASLRKLLSIIANRFAKKITGVNLDDIGCATKVLKREVVYDLPFRDEIHRIYPALVAMEGYRVRQIPVAHRPRVFGSSKYGYSRIWKFMLDLIFLKMRHRLVRRPFYLLGTAFFVFFIISILASLTAILLRAFSIKDNIDGSLVSLSIIMFALSIITLIQSLTVNEIFSRLDNIQKDG